MSEKTDYHSGKIGSFVQMTVSLIKANPALLQDVDYLKAQLKVAIPELANRSCCPNCGASMKEYIYTFDVLDGLLLLAMAKEVRERLRKRIPFTEANQVRVPGLGISHAVKCRTTRASKLGLITQLRTKDDRRVAGVWVITKRGFEALGGAQVPKMVKVWRKKIEERYDETTTLGEALEIHTRYLQEQLKKGKTLRQDYHEMVQEYNPKEWYDFEIHSGTLFG